ncbi:hypothetical protein LTR28_006432 [Elasticomyces elasticus]|nr:hypothetical protein LTR28_006432 [Elasticomyces elasticus]
MAPPTPSSTAPSPSFTTIRNRLQNIPPPLLPPGKPHDPALTDAIASLRVHPAIEALLHLQNLDLPSAHFLVRHMEAAPAHEGMYVHGILHRIEGDYDNARAWYADVCESDVFLAVWGGGDGGSGSEGKDAAAAKERALGLIGRIQAFNRKHGEGDRGALEQESRREIESVMKWCSDKFGTDRWEDATKAWVRPSEKIKKMGEDMVSGNAGYRNF